jgi:hypothetical protein
VERVHEHGAGEHHGGLASAEHARREQHEERPREVAEPEHEHGRDERPERPRQAGEGAPHRARRPRADPRRPVARQQEDGEDRDRGGDDAPRDDAAQRDGERHEADGEQRADHRAEHVGRALDPVGAREVRRLDLVGEQVVPQRRAEAASDPGRPAQRDERRHGVDEGHRSGGDTRDPVPERGEIALPADVVPDDAARELRQAEE